MDFQDQNCIIILEHYPQHMAQTKLKVSSQFNRKFIYFHQKIVSSQLISS